MAEATCAGIAQLKGALSLMQLGFARLVRLPEAERVKPEGLERMLQKAGWIWQSLCPPVEVRRAPLRIWHTK